MYAFVNSFQRVYSLLLRHVCRAFYVVSRVIRTTIGKSMDYGYHNHDLGELFHIGQVRSVVTW